jgi:hypothetical protein
MPCACAFSAGVDGSGFEPGDVRSLTQCTRYGWTDPGAMAAAHRSALYTLQLLVLISVK